MEREGPDRKAFVASAVVHLLAFLLMWWTRTAQPAPADFVTYDIQLVSPPSPVEGEPAVAEELTVETPDPEPEPETEPEPEEEPPPPEPEPEETEPEPEPEESEPEEPEPEEEPAPEERPPPTETADEETETGSPEPDPEAETSGEDINVRMEGVRRDYPAYYNNIIRQMRRCFRWRGPDGRLQATVRFYIHRDGTVSDISVVEESGNLEFDFEAMGAVECAGSGGRFGPLPDELPFDRLPVQFTFRPAG